MNFEFLSHWRRTSVCPALLSFCLLSVLRTDANPTGGTVNQGSATFSSSGSTFNINQSSANAFINWQSFNVGLGETVNFNQPSASSVTFNQINQGSASQILGDINANGYVVLENASGFYIGGQAVLTAHGLILTTATTPALNLGAGGPWSFDAPPPAAKIQNFGQINITGGGTAYLIADDIVNGGTINAPNGKIGLYDGETVLVSTSPSGEGISAEVTLPQGSVDNEGKLTADGGSVVAQAQFVNQNGIIQANSAENVNGTIELLGGSSVALGANSVISAQGNAQGVSSGGSVTIQAGNTYSDQAGSTIDVAGGAQGGNGGHVDICAPHMGAINSVIDGAAQNGFTGGILSIDPEDVWLDTADNAPQGSDYTFINIGNYKGMSQINIQADNNIVLNAIWNLSVPATLSLTAGNDITLNSGSAINAALSEIPTDVSLQAGNEIQIESGSTIQANGGMISLNAPTVDLAGTLQANSVGSANGLIDVDAAQSLILEASSAISAIGDSTATKPSPGGIVILDAGNTYSDASGSTISLAGTAGGDGGIVEIFDPQAASTSIQSTVSGALAYLVNPYDITFSGNPTVTSSSDLSDPNFDVSDLAQYSQIDLLAKDDITLNTILQLSGQTAPTTLSLTAGNEIILNANSGISAGQNWTVNLTGANGIAVNGPGPIGLQAGNDIVLNSILQLAGQTTLSTLNISAGNDITFAPTSGINAGEDWNVNLTAGTGFIPTSSQPAPVSGSDGIYLDGTTALTDSAYIRAQNGNINLWAANEVQVGWSANSGFAGIGKINQGESSITTTGGGNINVITLFGDVNTGSDPAGYKFYSTVPYTRVDPNLGGISTAAGGNVTIAAGGNVISSILTVTSQNEINGVYEDPGTGAFGSEPGNVTITAGGNIYGHYVVTDGTGTIIAGQNVGAAAGDPFALSLTSGGWSVNAPNGDVYLQEVGNPNGDFNDTLTLTGKKGPNYFLFTYSPQDYVDLSANGVFFTGTASSVPRLSGYPVPILYPPILDITAGSGGVTLEGNVTLFPSVDQNLDITTTDGGNFTSAETSAETPYELLMSDSAATQWVLGAFGSLDHGTLADEPDETSPVFIDISGSMENLDLITTKVTDIIVGGDMINCGFSGQNLQADDVTSINVAGQILNTSAYSFVTLNQGIPIIPVSDLLIGMGNSWNDVFTLAVNPAELATELATLESQGTPVSEWLNDLIEYASVFGEQTVNGQLVGLNPGFVYDQTTGQLGFAGTMPGNVLSELTQPITILHLVNGQPVINPSTGQLETDTISWATPSSVQSLFTDSQGRPSLTNIQLGDRVGGPGSFDITADSISLGNSYGILSCGAYDAAGGFNRYGNLASITPVGATINVLITGPDQPTDPGEPVGPDNPLVTSLNMLTSTIAALGGGDVNVIDALGSMDLGAPYLFATTAGSSTSAHLAYGVYTTGGGNVTISALGDVDIDGSRIATYNGGNIFVESLTGDVNVGSGNNDLNSVYVAFTAGSGAAAQYTEEVFGSGILAETLVPASQEGGTPPPNPAALPGNITVETPEGSIVTSSAGVLQETLDGTVAPGPTVTLYAGTPNPPGDWTSKASPLYLGNIDLGNSGVIGGTVNLEATGNVIGQIVSSGNSTVNAGQSFSGTILSAGSANVSGGGTISGTIIGVGGANVSGLGGVTASVLGQNVSVNGGASQSTLGSSATATASTQSAAQTASSQTQQQVAADTGTQDDDKKKKKTQIRKVGHVTVILASAQ